ncbi:MAG: SGNH/GDSL hydrolase family protein [Acidobacteria bacterium]|nr:SGNH/GDSL hydrolase family protein [Acidobacteriota bacterium]
MVTTTTPPKTTPNTESGKTQAPTPNVVPAPKAKKYKITLGAKEMTIRETVHISQGGSEMRVTLTNEFGETPLTISDAHIAMMATLGRILPNTDHALTFSGKPSVTIPAGQFIASDPIKLTLPIFSDVVVSLCVPEQSLKTVTQHSLSMATTYLADGDQTKSEELQDAYKIEHWYMLKDIQVNAEKHSGAVVTLGDSITDGAHSTPDTNRRWPDVLATRLAANKKTKHVSVLNEGISGNRILHDGTGPRALDRLDRDVLNAPGAKWVILLESINDIGHAGQPRNDDDKITADQLIDAMKQIVSRCHAKGLKIYGATLTPYLGAKYATPMGEEMRQKVNAFIRTPGNFDGVIDFEKAIEDPANPGHFLPTFDPGDHLHPNDKGYAAMGNAIDLKLFQ